MADETPQLSDKQLPWYRGLSKYQWWVLIIASMGWMFDTMDQQFFNLGRGPAMKEVLGVDPVVTGLEKLGEDAPKTYSADDLQALVEEDLITPFQVNKLLTDSAGNAKETATGKDVAKVIGGQALTPRYVELGTPLLPGRLGTLRLANHFGEEVIAENGIVDDRFSHDELKDLASEGMLNQDVVGLVVDKEGLDTEKGKSKTISLDNLRHYIGKQVLLGKTTFNAEDIHMLVSADLLTDAVAGTLLEATDTVPKDDVLRAVGKEAAEERETFTRDELLDLVILDAISREAALDLLDEETAARGVPATSTAPATSAAESTGTEDASTTDLVTKRNLIRYFGQEEAKAMADREGDFATFIFIMGWAIGGLFFGWVGDSLGRAKTMALTILTYAIFTGLNGYAQDPFQFHVLRFLTALGVGGEFAAGAALVAETMPDRSRPAALGALQALSAVGNMMGAALAVFIMPSLGWRWLFFVGAIPGLVAVIVFLKLKEPDKWKEARRKWLEERAAGIHEKRSSYLGLLSDSRWAKRAIVGLLLGVVGVGGLWGVGFFTPELNRLIAKHYSEEAKEQFVAYAFFLQQLGAFFGISAYTWISLTMGRRPAFAVFFLMAFVIVSYTFLFADTILEAYVLAPAIGFVTLGPFGGYAIYFPELFPTRLRSTGVGFCYNVGRFLAALIPQFKSGLKGLLMSGALVIPFLPAVAGSAERAIRYGSFLMIFIYLIGLFVLLFAPETKGEPLPED